MEVIVAIVLSDGFPRQGVINAAFVQNKVQGRWTANPWETSNEEHFTWSLLF
jgi:hypothetical protein